MPYDKVDKEILSRLSKYEEISTPEFIGRELLAKNLFSISDIWFWQCCLIQRLINQNKIRIVRREYQLNSLGYQIQVEILSIVK